MTAFIGIDLALTNTGVVSWSPEDGWDRCTIRSTPGDGTPTGFLSRAHRIVGEVINWADPDDSTVWAIESPALHAKGAAVDRMFAHWWIAMDDLTNHHEEPWVFTPSQIKKVATGRGNAKKDEVILAAAKRLPEADVRNEHEADAAWIAVCASIIAGQPIVGLPANHTAGLKRILLGKGAK